jgi:methylmalonyl-CoA/ethylmalonyl-CoA epimerase
MIKKVNHIAVVVPDLDGAMNFWVDALGLKLSHKEHVASQAVDVAFLPVGDSKIELIQPIDNESGVARYLAKKGPGMHHICFEVDDIEAALARLKEADVQLINEVPTVGADGRKFAFIHPKSANGVLVELYELAAE